MGPGSRSAVTSGPGMGLGSGRGRSKEWLLMEHDVFFWS